MNNTLRLPPTLGDAPGFRLMAPAPHVLEVSRKFTERFEALTPVTEIRSLSDEPARCLGCKCELAPQELIRKVCFDCKSRLDSGELLYPEIE